MENVGKRIENVKSMENAMLCMQSSKQDIIQFLKIQHQQTGKVPAVREICKKFGLSSKTLYVIFPGRKTEMCATAGVPIDDESFQKVAKATQAQKENREKEILENKELNLLKEEKEKIAEELRHVKAADECRETIRKLYIEKTRTSGIKDVFSSPEKMLDFMIHTYQRGSRILNGEDVWDSFNRHCLDSNLEVAKTLYETVGPLEDYEATIQEERTEGLDHYIQERLEDFLLEHETKEVQRTMQMKFEEVLLDFRCECGRRLTATVLKGSELHCPCGKVWIPKCGNCRQKLEFDTSRNVLYCRHCEMSFKANVHG